MLMSLADALAACQQLRETLSYCDLARRPSTDGHGGVYHHEQTSGVPKHRARKRGHYVDRLKLTVTVSTKRSGFPFSISGE